MISNLNYFSSDMSLSNPDIQAHMITDQDEYDYEENKENFFNNQYSNQQYSQNSSLRSSPINLRRSSSNANAQANERVPLQDLTESEESAQLPLNTTEYFIVQQENQFIQYRQQQKKNSSSPKIASTSNAKTIQKVTRANLLR